MSHTTAVAIFPGDRVEDFREFSNSWGSAPIVWRALSQRHLGWGPHEWVTRASKVDYGLWGLWKDLQVDESSRAVLLWTLDRLYVAKRNYSRMARDIRKFLEGIDEQGGVNHWAAIAAMLESDPDVPGIGLYCTSVCANPFWGPWDEEAERHGPLDWGTVYEVYEELDELKESGQ